MVELFCFIGVLFGLALWCWGVYTLDRIRRELTRIADAASRSTPSTMSMPSTKSASPLPSRAELISRQIDRQRP